LSLWLIVVLLLSNQPAHSKFLTASKSLQLKETVVVPKNYLSLTENVEKIQLENGLSVITKEVHTAPVVTVQVWYKVGSRNEEVGVNGIAHQLEHMMFKGTRSRPIQFGRLFSALGSDSNAFTSYDQTAYYGTVERDKLKALLVLEADRMQNSLIDSSELANEKRVVISELQGYENSPEYRLNRAIMQRAYPNHPYGLPVGGTKADVDKFQVEQVRSYYRKFYSPNNAVLVIVGDFNTAKTFKDIKEIFGKLPQNQNLTSSVPSIPTIATPSSPIILQEPGANALLEAVYPLPNINHPDTPAVDVMNFILSEGRNSRLYKALVESGVAVDVTATVATLLESGWYEILVTASQSQDLQNIDSIMRDAIANFFNGVSSEELKRAKTQLQAAMILGNRDITNLAMQLGNDEIVAGDYRYTDAYFAAVRKVTVQDITRVAKKYLKPEARTLGLFKPTHKQVKEISSKDNSGEIKENFSGATVNPAEVAKYLPSTDTQTTVSQVLPKQLRLQNGLRVLLLADKSTPTVTLSGYIKSGTEFDPENKAGLASLVADNLMNGTKTKDVLEIAKDLEERGASLDFETYREGVHIQGSSLADDFPVLLQTLSETIKNPTFPEKELELSRQQALTALKNELDDPLKVAKRTFVQSVYPKPHPSHTFPTEESLVRINRNDVINFKAKHYRPDNTVLVLVGNFTLEKVRSQIEKEFGDWQVVGAAPSLKYPGVSLPERTVRLNPVLPGKAQAITYMGYTAINRKDPRYYTALVLNQILGGDTLSSRLGAEVRDRQGLTYGIYSTFQAGRNFGTFWIEMQTSPEDAGKAIASTRKLIQQIHSAGVSDEEVETAKRTLISSYNVSLANPEELSYRIMMNKVYGLNEEELHSFTKKIQAVSRQEVNLASRELLHPDKITVVTAGPAVVAKGCGVRGAGC
jgi:zinc protease